MTSILVTDSNEQLSSPTVLENLQISTSESSNIKIDETLDYINIADWNIWEEAHWGVYYLKVEDWPYEKVRCFYYTFYPESYLSFCNLNIHNLTAPYKIQTQPHKLNMFQEAEITLHQGVPCVKIITKHVNNVLTIVVVYTAIFALSGLLLFAKNKSGAENVQYFLAILSVIFPILYKTFIYKAPFGIVDLYFGWNILLTKFPIFYQVLTAQKAKVSPNQPKTNNSIQQIDMYTDAQDEDIDNIPRQQNSKKLILVVYILGISISFAGLVGIFYTNVKDHIKDLIKQNIE